MKAGTKKIIGTIFAVLAALVSMAALLVWWVHATFIDYRCFFPGELKVRQEMFEADQTYLMGPAGINHAFVVYELPEKASARISEEGLKYLNSLPVTWAQKTQPGPPNAPSWDWMATPVPAEQNWLGRRHKRKDPWLPSILIFYNKEPDSDFMSMIPKQQQDSFNEAIQSSGSFYSYRGHNTLVVSPSQGRAYFLHRS